MDTCNLSNNPHHEHLLQKTAELAIQSIIIPDLIALYGGVLGYAHNYRQVGGMQHPLPSLICKWLEKSLAMQDYPLFLYNMVRFQLKKASFKLHSKNLVLNLLCTRKFVTTSLK